MPSAYACCELRHSRGSTGSDSSASTANTHSWIRHSGSPSASRTSASRPIGPLVSFAIGLTTVPSPPAAIELGPPVDARTESSEVVSTLESTRWREHLGIPWHGAVGVEEAPGRNFLGAIATQTLVG